MTDELDFERAPKKRSPWKWISVLVVCLFLMFVGTVGSALFVWLRIQGSQIEIPTSSQRVVPRTELPDTCVLFVRSDASPTTDELIQGVHVTDGTGKPLEWKSGSNGGAKIGSGRNSFESIARIDLKAAQTSGDIVFDATLLQGRVGDDSIKVVPDLIPEVFVAIFGGCGLCVISAVVGIVATIKIVIGFTRK